MTKPINIAMLHFEATLLLPPPKLRAGERSPATIFSQFIGEEILRGLHRRLCPEMNYSDAAEKLRWHLSVYEAGPWRTDRSAVGMPERYWGRIEAELWTYMRVRALVPAARSIRRALAR